MKKLFFITILSAFVCLSSAQKPVELRLNLQKGKTFVQNMDMKMKVKMDFQGMKIETDVPFSTRISSKVLDIQNGNFVMEYTYEELKIKLDIMGQKFGYDSSDKKQDLSKNLFAKSFSSFINNPYTMILDKRQNIVAIEGLDKLFASILEENNPFKAQIQSMFSEEKIKDNFSSTNIVFPQEPVYKGFTWTSETSQNVQGTNLQTKNTYKVENLTKKTAEISSVSEMQMDFSINQSGQQSNIKIQNAQINGTYIIDLKTGWTTSAKVNTDMTMQMTMNQGGREISIPMHMIVEIILK